MSRPQLQPGGAVRGKLMSACYVGSSSWTDGGGGVVGWWGWGAGVGCGCGRVWVESPDAHALTGGQARLAPPRLRCGRPERSSTMCTRASSRGAAPGEALNNSVRYQQKHHRGRTGKQALLSSGSCWEGGSRGWQRPGFPTSARDSAYEQCDTASAGGPPVKSPKRWMPFRSPRACREWREGWRCGR